MPEHQTRQFETVGQLAQTYRTQQKVVQIISLAQSYRIPVSQSNSKQSHMSKGGRGRGVPRRRRSGSGYAGDAADGGRRERARGRGRDAVGGRGRRAVLSRLR